MGYDYGYLWGKNNVVWDANQWIADFSKENADFRDMRKAVFATTVKAVQENGYLVKTGEKENQFVKVDLEFSPDVCEKTKFYFIKTFPIPNIYHDITEYRVLKKDCLLVAKELVDSNSGKVAVLNMASRQNPGGGVATGAGAQEEYLFRCSDYYHSLYQFVDYGWEYNVPRKMYSYPLDRNFGGVFSPNITVFRGPEEDGYPFLENPWKINFIAVPGLRNPEILIDENQQITLPPILMDALRNKIRTILDIAIDNHITILVLSALGCGAFHNPPYIVASLFKEILRENLYRNAFAKVYFAIKPDHNSRDIDLAGIFSEVFSDLLVL